MSLNQNNNSIKIFFLRVFACIIVAIVMLVGAIFLEFSAGQSDQNVLQELPTSQAISVRRWYGFGRIVEFRIISDHKRNVTDSDFKNIGKLDALELLDLADTHIEAEQADELSKLTKLRVLILKGTDIGEEFVEVLAKMPHLSRLDISSTKISRNGFLHLQGELKETEIYHY